MLQGFIPFEPIYTGPDKPLHDRLSLSQMSRIEQNTNCFYLGNVGEIYRILDRLKHKIGSPSQQLKNVIKKYDGIMDEAQKQWDLKHESKNFINKIWNVISTSPKKKKRKLIQEEYPF